MTTTAVKVALSPRLGALPTAREREPKARGAVFTRPAVVDFILDLAGYTQDRPLHELRILEPSFGGGQFVKAAAERLIRSWRTSDFAPAVDVLFGALRAVELDELTYMAARADLATTLASLGLSGTEARALTAAWLTCDDFLLGDIDGTFDFVVGNPPYVRQENIESGMLATYRGKFPTMVGRADLYVAFFERSLDLLKPGGRLAFICADAWVKNEYGRALRRKVAEGFHLVDYVDMYGVDAFESEVGAYPSITVIAKTPPELSRVTRAESAEASHLTHLRGAILAGADGGEPGTVSRRVVVRPAGAPWLLGSRDRLPAIHHMEATIPTLAESGVTVGIGVATGADKVFMGPFASLDVEDDRKLPLATNRCVPNGQLAWTGMGVLNPYTDHGALVDLAEYPKLAAHLEQHRAQLEARHTARSDPGRRWYKTIDRITPSLTTREKLLVPDIKGDGDSIAFDPGTLYPHHNLYYMTSDRWNLRALQALLRSGIAHLFVEAYSVRIGGGYLRFQAQNLKRIRIPEWETLSESQRRDLTKAGEAGLKVDVGFLERVYRMPEGSLAFMAAVT